MTTPRLHAAPAATLRASIEARVKRRLHREIAATPFAHAIVLNWYRNGEQYPHRCTDYFPIAAATDAVLAESMRRHVADEDKHAALYAAAIRKLGEPVHDLPVDAIYNDTVRRNTDRADSFAIDADDDADRRVFKLANFLAHVHHIERRIARSLEFHYDACALSPSAYPSKAVGTVLRDEARHVEYTREAVFGLLPRSRAQTVLTRHAAAEARANREFSARQLRHLMRTAPTHFPAASRTLYALCAFLLHGVRAND